MNTLQSLMDYVHSISIEHGAINWNIMMDLSVKLNALLQTEQERMYEMEHTLAKMKAAYLSEGNTAAYAKLMTEGSEEWLTYKKQKALVERAIETIRLCKKHATLSKEIEYGQS